MKGKKDNKNLNGIKKQSRVKVAAKANKLTVLLSSESLETRPLVKQLLLWFNVLQKRIDNSEGGVDCDSKSCFRYKIV